MKAFFASRSNEWVTGVRQGRNSRNALTALPQISPKRILTIGSATCTSVASNYTKLKEDSLKKVAAPNDDAVHRRMRGLVIVASFHIEFVLPAATARNLLRRNSVYKVDSMFSFVRRVGLCIREKWYFVVKSPRLAKAAALT